MALLNQGTSASNLSDETAPEEDEVRIVLPSSNYKDIQVINIISDHLFFSLYRKKIYIGW